MNTRTSRPDRGTLAQPTDLSQMAGHAEQAAQLLRALSSPHRLMVLCVLSQGELSVGELNQRVPLSQSALSQHLAVLRQEGLVHTRRESQTIYYGLTEGPAMGIVKLLHGHFCMPVARRRARPRKT